MGALGLGSALKPACEPITVARKPISEKNLADNHLKWGVGGINIDGCRIGMEKIHISGGGGGKGTGWGKKEEINEERFGRFPANLIHDGSQEVLDLFPNTKSGIINPRIVNTPTHQGTSFPSGARSTNQTFGGDSGSAARFFYCPKASKSERNRGCEGLEEKLCGMMEDDNYPIKTGSGNLRQTKRTNNHPTVKPIALMEYLVKLITREGQTVLDPFAGSGTTGIACKNLNRNAILIEREAEYVEIAKCRMAV